MGFRISTKCGLFIFFIPLLLFGQQKELHLVEDPNIIYDAVKEFDKEIKYYDSLAIVAEQMDHPFLYALATMGKGILNRYNFDSPEIEIAFDQFTEALVIVKSLPKVPEDVITKLYYHLATTERRRLNLENAKHFLQLSILQADVENNPVFRARAYNAFANIENDLGNRKEAIRYILQSIETRKSLGIKDDDHLYDSWYNLSIYYLLDNQFEKSNWAINQSLYENSLRSRPATWILRLSLIIKAINYGELGLIDSTRVFYNSLIEIPPSEYDDYTINWNRGKIERLIAEYDKSIVSLQKALGEIFNNFRPNDLLDLPEITDANSHSEEIDANDTQSILNELALSFKKKFEISGEIEFLFHIRKIYKLLDFVLMNQRMESMEQSFSIHVGAHGYEFYENALDNLYDLYKVTSENEILAEALNFVERNKQIELLKNKIINANLDEKIGQRKTIDQLLYSMEQEKLRMSNIRVSDSTLLVRHLENIADIRLALKRESDDFEIPDFNFGSFSVDLYNLQNWLDNSAAAFLYYWGQRNLYILTVSKYEVLFDRIPTDDLAGKVDYFINKLSASPSNIEKNYVRDYEVNGHQLYQLLLGKYLDKLNSPDKFQELLIVADGPLRSMPFKALVMNRGKHDISDFKNVDYLIHHLNIQQSFSINHIFQDLSYNKKGNELLTFSWSDLEGAIWETQKISSIWNGKLTSYSGKSFSKEELKEDIHNYDVIHLATHGTYDSDLNISYLNINESERATTEESRLYTHEIYPMQLKAKLVTLSACESGLGDALEGEGVFNLARAFNYAGAENIVMSLWKLDDIRTAQIMPTFYQKIQDGESIHRALQEAQKKFLNGAEGRLAHPYYWAGLSALGNDSYVLPDQFGMFHSSFILLLILLIGCIIWKFQLLRS